MQDISVRLAWLHQLKRHKRIGVHEMLTWWKRGPPEPRQYRDPEDGEGDEDVEVQHSRRELACHFACDNPLCLNPSHLHWCSAQDNEVAPWQRRAMQVSMREYPGPVHSLHPHPFSAPPPLHQLNRAFMSCARRLPFKRVAGSRRRKHFGRLHALHCPL